MSLSVAKPHVLSVSLKKDFYQLHCTTSSFVPPGEDWCLRMCRSFQVMDHSWPMGSVKLVAIAWYHQGIFSCVTCCNVPSWPKKVPRLLFHVSDDESWG